MPGAKWVRSKSGGWEVFVSRPRKVKRQTQQYVPEHLHTRLNDDSATGVKWAALGKTYDPPSGSQMHRPGSQNRNKG